MEANSEKQKEKKIFKAEGNLLNKWQTFVSCHPAGESSGKFVKMHQW